MPYWRLSSFYFFYFAVLGILVPYWGLFLQHRGFDAMAIGQLMAILMATKIVAPNLWGWLGDYLGHRMMIVRAASLASVLVFGLMFVVRDFWAVALAMALYSFFWNASLPQFEVITLNYLGDRATRYARIRAWGSIGFIIAVVALGVLVDRAGTAVVLPSVMVIFVSIWLTSLTVRDPDPEPHPAQQVSLGSLLRQPPVIAFFVAVMLMQASHGPYYTFYSIYMEDHGYSKTLIGQLWALGVLAEVAIFMVMHRLLERFEAARVLVASLGLATLRWLLIGYLPGSVVALLFAQLLHAATFGTFHGAAIDLVHRQFPGRLQGRGQALYSSLSFGVGGAIGSLASGLAWDALGPATSFLLAALTALLGALVVWKGLCGAARA
ncbi:MFS transporter [endosymbiont of unidentified scaly snail isolate Monju]|uniref:MFS transporter n=1 Tax=endosymbiont of unidentified scaly snail isolate Monju TaxID=1248727 RepID=UPI0003892346|nr:MFS transporter [endosymbiont of unidentified scaly snail isolate Monju]BAN69142.1 MFS transporter, PPP family, 3-phenylpropionic acid transporter [endosymbiont of unidentified scaly snail isolate Monju]